MGTAGLGIPPNRKGGPMHGLRRLFAPLGVAVAVAALAACSSTGFDQAGVAAPPPAPPQGTQIGAATPA